MRLRICPGPAMSIRRDTVNDDAVAHVNDAIEIGGGFGIVGDHDDSLAEILVEAAEHIKDDFGIFCVEIAGGLIGEKNFGLVDDGTGDGDALLLAAGHFRGAVMEAALESEELGDYIEAVRIEAVAMNILSDGDVASGGERGEKIEALENEADLAAAELGALGVSHGGEVVAIDIDFAARGLREAADDVKERGFAAAGRAHDGDGFAGEHVEIDAAKGGDFHFAGVIKLPEILGFEYRLQSLQLRLRGVIRLRVYSNRD